MACETVEGHREPWSAMKEQGIAKVYRACSYPAMNRTGLLLLGLLFTMSTHGQGTVVFNNNASSNYNIYTNGPGDTPGLISGANRYHFGLYASTDLTASESSLTLVGLATNSALWGKFNGGNPFALPSGYAPGIQIRFQLRGWGNAQTDPSNLVFGRSPLGTTTLGGGPTPPGALFGTAPGQLTSGFFLIVPEPSSSVLAALGALSLLVLSRRTTRSP